MVRKVLHTIRKHAMVKAPGLVAAAVSGGADSVAMLHALVELKGELGIELVVCHLDHALRGKESAGDYDFVEGLARGLELPFEGARLAPGALKGMKGESLQEAARDERYAFLRAVAKRRGAGLIATGHTMDDTAETVLLRLFKGAATGGLAGIPPAGRGLIRPLIEVTRAEVEAYLQSNGIAHVEDSSNAGDEYLRNSIRLNLMPLIKERYNPNIVKTIARTASLLARDDAYLEREAVSYYVAAVVGATDDRITFDRRVLLKTHPAIAARVLLRAARTIGKGALLTSAHVEACLSVIEGNKPNAGARLPARLVFMREYERVHMSRSTGQQAPAGFSAVLVVPGVTGVEGTDIRVEATIIDSTAGGPLKPRGANEALFDYDRLPAPLTIRSVRPGDRLRPMGMEGHKKVKDVFIDAKVPARLRPRVPLLEGGGELLWVLGLKRSALFGVTAGTKRVLRLMCEGFKETDNQGEGL